MLMELIQSYVRFYLFSCFDAKRGLLTFVFLVPIFIFCNSASAVDWSFTPSATLSESYDSNFRFRSTPIPGTSKDDYITSLSPVASVTGETEATKFQFDTVTNGEVYIKNPKFDTINTNSTASLTESWSQRLSTTANVGLVHDWTLEDQLQTSGIITEKTERFLFNSGLSGKYDLNESLNLTASGQYARTIFPAGTLPDSFVYQGTITPIWAVTPRDNIGFSSNFTDTEYDISTKIRTVTEMLYWERTLTETLSFKLSGGYYFTTLDFITRTPKFVLSQTDNDSGFVFGVDLKKDWSEVFSTTFSAGSQQYNDVNARSFDSTFFSIGARYRVSDVTTVSFNARYNLNDQISRGSEEINYYIINPSIERNLTDNLIVRLAGSYENEADKDLGGVPGSKSNVDRFRTWAELTYKWPRFLSTH
jgi:hypothetical protein